MYQLHSEALRGLDGQPLIDRLLVCDPYLKLYEDACQRQDFKACETIAFDFQMKLDLGTNQRLETYKRKKYAIDHYTCRVCGNRNVCRDFNNAVFVCLECGTSNFYGCNDDLNSLEFETRISLPGQQYTYKPASHFANLLKNVQGHTRKVFPAQFYSELRKKFLWYGIHPKDITPLAVREMLKDFVFGKKKGSSYYTYIFSIARMLNPQYENVIFTVEEHDTLMAMFRQVYAVYSKHVNQVEPTRKNFFSYPFAAYKFCELQRWIHHQKVFQLLKSRDKLRKHDAVMQSIFKELGWSWTHTI